MSKIGTKVQHWNFERGREAEAVNAAIAPPDVDAQPAVAEDYKDAAAVGSKIAAPCPVLGKKLGAGGEAVERHHVDHLQRARDFLIFSEKSCLLCVSLVGGTEDDLLAEEMPLELHLFLIIAASFLKKCLLRNLAVRPLRKLRLLEI